MEKIDTQTKNEDAINAVLFGNDIKPAFDSDPIKIPFLTAFKHSLEMMIKNAETKEDLNVIGAKFNEVIDNKYDIDIWDYQLQAAKKMTEIYKNLVLEVKK